MELVLQQKQTLNLVMTTELRQAIELLQYSTYDLLQFLREQELENPLIELVEKGYETPYREKRQTSYKSQETEVDPFDFIANNEKEMREKIIEQTTWLAIDETQRKMLQYLILNLDENGYLILTNDEIAHYLGINQQEVIEMISLLQQLEPIGIGARNLKECLLLQARYYYPDEKALEIIIKDHLELLANKMWNKISKLINVPLSEIKEAYELIKTLNPRPVSLVSSSSAQYLNPDIIVDTDESGEEFSVYLNDGYIPDIRFNEDYSSILKSEHQMSKYVQDHFKNYRWLLNSIEQRRTTILKVMQVIINRQRKFFLEGFKALKPLTLKEVADEIEMHESTVSRATANKVVQTPKGSFELRLLFSTKIHTKSGDSTSQTKVKILIEELINKEDKLKPLSDQKIADHLKADKGIKISRRTVAKYRDELNIPSSSKRKEIKV